MIAPSAATHLGFLAMIREAGSYSGGYLVTNLWGRPLEFRLSTPVQPNRVQQILYGDTLAEHVCSEVIGKTLVEKTATPAAVVLTDCGEALALRRSLDIPVVWIAGPPGESDWTIPSSALRIHSEFPDDAARLQELIDRLKGLDLIEPFQRVRDAVAEARKLGAMQRAG